MSRGLAISVPDPVVMNRDATSHSDRSLKEKHRHTAAIQAITMLHCGWHSHQSLN